MDMEIDGNGVAVPGGGSPNEVDECGTFIPVRAAENFSVNADDGAPVGARDVRIGHVSGFQFRDVALAAFACVPGTSGPDRDRELRLRHPQFGPTILDHQAEGRSERRRFHQLLPTWPKVRA